jgi:hypothetical protein
VIDSLCGNDAIPCALNHASEQSLNVGSFTQELTLGRVVPSNDTENARKPRHRRAQLFDIRILKPSDLQHQL